MRNFLVRTLGPRLQRENYVLRYELRSTSDRLSERLIGESPAILQVRAAIARVAPLPTSVLLTGRSGTGNEVAAQSLHALSDRADKPFVPVNCAAIPPELIESELFGHLKGRLHRRRGGARRPVHARPAPCARSRCGRDHRRRPAVKDGRRGRRT